MGKLKKAAALTNENSQSGSLYQIKYYPRGLLRTTIHKRFPDS